MKHTITSIGKSVLEQSIDVYQFGNGVKKVLIIGGTHGDEITAYELVDSLLNDLLSTQVSIEDITLYIIPRHSPDAITANTRVNHNSVDINRNFDVNWKPDSTKDRYFPGAFPLSEPESKLLSEFVKKTMPNRILSVHAPLDFIDFDGPVGEKLAIRMAEKSNMEIKQIDYETPGSFGQFCLKLNIPLVTLEMPKTGEKSAMYEWQREALFAFISG